MAQIEFQVGVDTSGQGKAALAQLDNGLDKTVQKFARGKGMTMEFNRVLQDMPYFMTSVQFGFLAIGNNVQMMADRMMYAKSSGQSMTEMLKSTFSGFNLVQIGVNLAMSALLAYAIAQKDTKKEMETWDLKSLIGNINSYAESLAKVKKELTALSDVDLGKTVGEINKKIAENLRGQLRAFEAVSATYTVGGAAGALIQAIFGKPEDYGEALKKLNDTLKIADEEIVKRLSNNKSWNYWDTRVKDLTEKIHAGDMSLIGDLRKAQAELKKIEDIIDPKKEKFSAKAKKFYATAEEMPPAFFSDLASRMYNSLESSFKRMGVWDDTHKAIAMSLTINTQDTLTKTKLNLISVPVKPKLEKYTEKDAKEDMPQFSIFSDAFSQTLADGGMQAFEKIFGEANSLFEQFLQNVMAGFMRLAEQELGMWLFKTMLAIGSGGTSVGISSSFTAADYASGTPIFKMGQNSQQQTMVINLNMGNQNLGQVVATGYNIAVKRRYVA
jgi:hypothetical protein